MTTINFKLSKRLNELGLLDNIETEYVYQKNYILKQFSRGERIEDFYDNGFSLMQNKRGDSVYNKFVNLVPKGIYKGYITFKTLTLEELPKFIFDIVGENRLNKHLNSKYSALEIFNFSINDYEKIINDLILN